MAFLIPLAARALPMLGGLLARGGGGMLARAGGSKIAGNLGGEALGMMGMDPLSMGMDLFSKVAGGDEPTTSLTPSDKDSSFKSSPMSGTLDKLKNIPGLGPIAGLLSMVIEALGNAKDKSSNSGPGDASQATPALVSSAFSGRDAGAQQNNQTMAA